MTETLQELRSALAVRDELVVERCREVRSRAVREQERYTRMARWLAAHRSDFDARAFATEFECDPAYAAMEDRLRDVEVDGRIINALWNAEVAGFVARVASIAESPRQLQRRYLHAMGDYYKLRASAIRCATDLGCAESVIKLWTLLLPPWPVT